ncbi:MAG TPA: hypothetical protein VGI81_26770 [Tepidisphaeraceae bacterium]|jgi:hypothetical protein
MTAEDAKEILNQVEQGRWAWLKVKRFVPEAHATLEERYAALERHHAEETARMVEVIRDLCTALSSRRPAGGGGRDEREHDADVQPGAGGRDRR